MLKYSAVSFTLFIATLPNRLVLIDLNRRTQSSSKYVLKGQQKQLSMGTSTEMIDASSTIRDFEDRLSLLTSPLAEDPSMSDGGEQIVLKNLEVQQNTEIDEDLSPSSSSSSRPNSRRANDRLLKAARTAVLATKEQFWDSNEPGIVAAQIAVDRWEEVYVWLRNAVVASSRSVAGIYGASKSGLQELDKGLLVPVRDYLLLPTFGFVEYVASETSSFIKSSEADRVRSIVAEGSADFVTRAVPFGLGETIVLPAVRLSSEAMQSLWNVARYPVPSQRRVRDTVDFLLNGSKENLSVCSREIVWYFRRADANISRTLRRTQWVILGSGPYETLDSIGQQEIINHVCERYLSIGKGDEGDDNIHDDTALMVARYEFMANVRVCNRSLYRDLVETGLLKERGGASTNNDEWLLARPEYRKSSSDLFLLDEHESNDESKVFALWFRLPFENGKKPKKDVPWVRFEPSEGEMLEEKYQSILKQSRTPKDSNAATAATRVSTTTKEQSDSTSWDSPKYVTNAKWYNPNFDRDVFVDQKRHVVTFVRYDQQLRRDGKVGSQLSDVDDDENSLHAWEAERLFTPPPPILGLYRPTLWRSYGPDEIRRAVWFLETPRNGLQPYGEDAQAVLEDAYQFLKWKIGSERKLDKSEAQEFDDEGRKTSNDNVLLTIQVSNPEGSEQQLVQFTSLTLATAIGKGLGGALSLFKRRVYRGAYNYTSRDEDDTSVNNCTVDAVQSQISEVSGWTTTAEEALEKLSLTIPSEDSLNSTESRDKNLNTEYKESFADISEQDICAKTPRDSRSDAESFHSYTSGSSLAFQMEITRKSLIDTDDNDIEVDHLILVVHGIGEMMQASDFFGLKKVPTIVECCGYLRDNHEEIADSREVWKSTIKPSRVEYLPIEWHEAFSIQSTRRPLSELISSHTNKHSNKVSVEDISLSTIPNLRSFANDTLIDILYFMSPAHHDIIIDIVSFELNFVVDRFRKLTGFKGDISLIGHSIGSVIAWDILDHQENSSSISRSSTAQKDSTLANADDSYRYPQLNFAVDTFYLLGSPIPVFLMIRNQEKPLSTAFTLKGCPRVFNIFHPYDPVSYRIEPLLHPRNSEIEPDIMTHWNGGFRFQYQTKRLWERLVDQTSRAEDNVIRSIESGIEALGLVDSTFTKDVDHKVDTRRSNDEDTPHELITGLLNGGRRIDYMLQEKEIDRANEYVAALAAHSCYWLEKDLSLFIANEIYFQKERKFDSKNR